MHEAALTVASGGLITDFHALDVKGMKPLRGFRTRLGWVKRRVTDGQADEHA